jgi:hypothetical protein
MDLDGGIFLIEINLLKAGGFHEPVKLLEQIFMLGCLKRCKIDS